MQRFAKTPEPPYYAVIFTSQRADGDMGYAAMADRMLELASQQDGFLGAESTRDASGFGMTISYWSSERAIVQWKANTAHLNAQKIGHATWYDHYEIRVAKVERAYAKT